MAGAWASLSGVTKRYGPTAALQDVSFELKAGEVVGYLGPNGAGKTTTLKLLAGLTKPTSGRVSLCGVDPGTDRIAALRKVGVLVESPGILPYLRSDDLLDHVARVKGIALAARAGEARRVADQLGVAECLGKTLGSLSTGSLRRILIASALIGEPEGLLLDEPTLGLDPAARGDLRRLLKTLARSGTSIFLSTHLLEDVAEVGDRVLFLREGRLVGSERVTTEGRRRLRLTFGSDVAPARIAPLLGPGASAEALSAREILVDLDPDDARQIELLRAVVAQGLPLLSAEVVASDLLARYLHHVGREEAEA